MPNTLTGEVVCDSIQTTKKKRIHVEIGDAIEEIYKDIPDGHCAELAEH